MPTTTPAPIAVTIPTVNTCPTTGMNCRATSPTAVPIPTIQPRMVEPMPELVLSTIKEDSSP